MVQHGVGAVNMPACSVFFIPVLRRQEQQGDWGTVTTGQGFVE